VEHNHPPSEIIIAWVTTPWRLDYYDKPSLIAKCIFHSQHATYRCQSLGLLCLFLTAKAARSHIPNVTLFQWNLHAFNGKIFTA
jgi:hypothetical protein